MSTRSRWSSLRADTSRWRRPNASANRHAIRLRKQGSERPAPVSLDTDVTRT